MRLSMRRHVPPSPAEIAQKFKRQKISYIYNSIIGKKDSVRRVANGREPMPKRLTLTILLSCWSPLAWADAAPDCSQDKDIDLRIDGCTRFIKKNPKIASAYENRGLAYLDKGDWDRAIADATNAIRRNPRYGAAYQRRSFAYAKTGDYVIPSPIRPGRWNSIPRWWPLIKDAPSPMRGLATTTMPSRMRARSSNSTQGRRLPIIGAASSPRKGRRPEHRRREQGHRT
jgi:tetratricopeptide (TPR) repeat protein